MATGNPAPSVELGLIPFIPSQEQAVADLNTIFYDKNKKRIVMKTEKKMDTGGRPSEIMVTEKAVIHGTNTDPKILAMAGVASALTNVNNVS